MTINELISRLQHLKKLYKADPPEDGDPNVRVAIYDSRNQQLAPMDIDARDNIIVFEPL